MFKKLFFLASFFIFSLIIFSEEKKYLVWFEDGLWIYYENSNSFFKLVGNKEQIRAATWSPDGKYIAYGFARIDNTSDLVIIDENGKELSRAKISHMEGDDGFDDIRDINRIEWRGDNTIITDSEVSRFGGYIDIWEIDSSFKVKHIKRISSFYVDGCEISPNKKYMFCNSSEYEMPNEGEEMKLIKKYLDIFDLSKKKSPEDFAYEDPEPKYFDAEIFPNAKERGFLSDEVIFFITEDNEYYIFNFKNEKLEKVKEMPKNIKFKEVPTSLKFKYKGKKVIQHRVLDLFIE